MAKPALPKFFSNKLLPDEATPARVEAQEDDFDAATESSKAARVGMWALGLGLGGFLIWAVLAPLDEGVPSQGMVSIDTKRKAVQHPTGGIVKEVLAHEGERVKEGQVLFRLDEAAARANFESIRQHYLGLRATQARLVAEQTGAPSMTLHPDLIAASKDPLIQAQISTQEQLFRSRRASIEADLQGAKESIAGQQALLASYQNMIVSRREQLKLVNEELASTRDLVRDGYAPRNRQLELERMVADANTSIAEMLGNIMRTQSAISELRQKVISMQQAYRKDVESQLSDANRDVLSDEQKFRAFADELGRTDIKSPATGQVLGIVAQTVGGVIQAGQKLADIVPDNELLTLETKVPPNVIERVRPGLPVDIRFTNFASSPQLIVEGKVISVSGDLLTDSQGNNPYYLARVQVTPAGYKTLGNRTLQPGMPVDVVLKTGERSMLAYLLHPLTKRMAGAMKED
ncbi:HlyD family type I secretion periplasmic adaptor subunit [Caenimonas aquaedulcis]|uniref:Membrane fusion protein (MFP) family protein n=1 Tax=Caenimonas aquaedulcis TaxID=2793270 RepID=A0A931H770_9BURK|nr:HlyD family type I secretion periplasmic adaptor subunit [Caenimonas aquaedulcis]MBG9389803.1 HlyD family type I secretion periplasmic adaptor subunit [Caenimonas aquaedulcis]